MIKIKTQHACYGDKKRVKEKHFSVVSSVLPYQKVNDNEDEMLADSVRRCGVHLVFRAR